MKKFAPFFVILAASLWAVDGIVLRPSLYNLPVTLVVFLESTIVALLLTPFMYTYFEDVKKLTSKDWLAYFGVAILGGAIGTMAITKALFYVNYVNLSIVILIQKLQPVFAISLAAIFLKEKQPTFGLHIPNISAGDKTTLAALFALLAALSFSSSTVLSKRALKNVSFELGTYLRFAITSVIMLIIVLASGTMNSIDDVSTKQIYIFILIAFTTGGPAIFLYYYGLKRISASVASICELAFPLTAVVLEFVLRDNILGPVQWVGALILLFSILRVTGITKIMAKNSS